MVSKMLTILLSLCGLTLAVLAVVIFYANYRDVASRWLGAFTVSGLLWLLANLLANVSSVARTNLFFSRAALIGASLLPLTYLFFCIYFTKYKVSRLWKLLIILPVAALLATTPTTLNVVSVSKHDLAINPGVSYILLLVILVLYFGYGIRLLLREYRQAQLMRQRQLYYVLLGTSLTLIPGIIFSGILPIFGYSGAVSFSPAVSLFFATLTAYAIIKHRLFNIRLVVARSIAYIATLTVLASVFGFLAFGLLALIFNLHLPIGAQIFISAATAVAAAGFARLKKFFDQITNSLFYADSYDPQALFDSLNAVLVTTLDLDKLLKHVTSLLAQELKASYCSIGIKGATAGSLRTIGTEKRSIDMDDVVLFRKLVAKYHQGVLVTDYLEAHTDEPMKTLLAHYGIVVLVRLRPNSESKDDLGYIALGVKRSGNPYTSQDLRVLETIANELIIATQNALHFEEIQNFNETLQQNVGEATRKLRSTNEKLQALDATKDEFITMASHQLRTPLTSVKGYLSMVLEGDAGKLNAQQEQLLTQSYASSQRMVYLISDLLNLSRLNTGKFVIEPSPVDLRNVVLAEIDQLRETAKSRDVTIAYTNPPSFPKLMLDETKIHQVIMNFIDNAIYYTPAGGSITVSLRETPTAVEYRVIDNGIGVPKSEQHKLFTKFYRAPNAQRARPDGTGLGLFMAKKVIVAQGGAIIFESEEGKGSTFGFRFSKAKHAVSGPPPTPKQAIAK